MNASVWIWLRRGSGLFVGLLTLGIVVALMVSVDGWEKEWGWGLRLPADPTIVIAPLVAAAAAFDGARRVAPTLAELAGSVARGRVAVLLPALAIWLWTMAAYTLVWIGVSAILWSHDAVGTPDLWALVEVAFVLAAAAAFGACVGSIGTSPFLAPLAAVATYAITIGVVDKGYTTPFATLGSRETLIGWERNASYALAVMICAGLVAVVAAYAAGRLLTGGRSQMRAMAILLAAGAAVAVASAYLTASSGDQFVPTTEPEVCVGAEPVVCGPVSSERFLIDAQAGLHQRSAQFAGADIPMAAHHR